jgi:hypothetical protein
MDEALTGPELRAELERLGISRAEFARICGVQWKAVNFWGMDADDPKALPVPQYAVTIVRLLRENLRLKLRVAALEHKADMLDELEERLRGRIRAPAEV